MCTTMENHDEMKRAPEHDLIEEDHEEFWDKECALHPEHPGCKDYEE